MRWFGINSLGGGPKMRQRSYDGHKGVSPSGLQMNDRREEG